MPETKPAITALTFRFSLEAIALYKYLKENKEYILSKQLLRSGTSIGANVIESQDAQSKSDFISKLSIALKEAKETKYWLSLLFESGYLSNYEDYLKTSEDLDTIISTLVKIIKTTKERYLKK